MPHARCTVLVFLLTASGPGGALSAEPAMASEPSDTPAPPEHAAHTRRLRTADPWMRALVDDGLRASPTLRRLAARIERSDVVVYLQCDPQPMPGVAGRLTFVSAAAGLRYLVIRLVAAGPRAQQIALLGHELQHAVEVADRPAIVDSESLAREYRHFAHASFRQSTLAFDTDAAIRVGHDVLEEVIALRGATHARLTQAPTD